MPKVRLRISWTEVESRSTDVVLLLTPDELDEIEDGYGIANDKWRDAVREVEGEVEMLHDEVDYIEVLNRRVRSK